MADDKPVKVGATEVTEETKRGRLPRAIRNANALITAAKTLETGERVCKAIKKSGLRCRRYAIKGGWVCPTHGGSAPQVKRKAERRLLAMVEPSIIRLEALIHQTEHLPTALGAIKTVLERAGANPFGALSKDGGDKDMRPIINIGIAVGGIAPPQVTVGLIPAAHTTEGEIAGDAADTDDRDA